MLQQEKLYVVPMRIFKYRCPIDEPDAPLPGECIFANKDDTCIKCGVNRNKVRTILEIVSDLYYKTIPFGLRPKNIWRAFRDWGWKRYTTIKPRKLDHGWCDRSHLMFHMVFEIACRFIEEEGPKTQEEWDWQKKHNPLFWESWHVTKGICNWWLNEYQEDYVYGLSDEEFDKQFPWKMPPKDQYDGSLDDRRSLERYYAQNNYDREILEKAKRLIDLSPWYWV